MARSLEQGQRVLEAQNEELRQSERLKSQLVSIVSHELRNPLTSILGYTSLLLARDFDKDESRRYLEIIQQQGNRLTSLIDHFLDSESVESGRIEIDLKPFDLKPLLVAEAKLVADKSTEHTVEVVIGPDDAPGEGRSRPARAGLREPARQRGQVLAGRRDRRGGRRDRRRRRARPRTRRGDRCARRAPAADLHEVLPRRTPARAVSRAPGSGSPSRARSSRRTAASINFTSSSGRGLVLLARAAARSSDRSGHRARGRDLTSLSERRERAIAVIVGR